MLAYVSRVHNVECDVDQSSFTLEDVESNIVRCPDQEAAQKMIDGEQCWAPPWASSQQQCRCGAWEMRLCGLQAQVQQDGRNVFGSGRARQQRCSRISRSSNSRGASVSDGAPHVGPRHLAPSP